MAYVHGSRIPNAMDTAGAPSRVRYGAQTQQNRPSKKKAIDTVAPYVDIATRIPTRIYHSKELGSSTHG